MPKKKGRSFRPVSPYKAEKLALYKINIDNDKERIHPPICDSCRSKFFRFRTNKNQNKSFKIQIPVQFNFQPHTSDCKISHGLETFVLA